MNPINQGIRYTLILLGILLILFTVGFGLHLDSVKPVTEGASNLTGSLVILGLIAVYFLPGLNAVRINHPNYLIILILNTFLAWTLLGWIFVLIWSCYPPRQRETLRPTGPPPAPVGKSLKQQLLEVDRLRRDTLLSEDEARNHRSRLLAGISGESLADRLMALRDLRDTKIITVPEHDEARLLLVQ